MNYIEDAGIVIECAVSEGERWSTAPVVETENRWNGGVVFEETVTKRDVATRTFKKEDVGVIRPVSENAVFKTMGGAMTCNETDGGCYDHIFKMDFSTIEKIKGVLL